MVSLVKQAKPRALLSALMTHQAWICSRFKEFSVRRGQLADGQKGAVMSGGATATPVPYNACLALPFHERQIVRPQRRAAVPAGAAEHSSISNVLQR
ncbi:hypothetical protein [Acidovorax sp. SUPP2825]|uniref:hypothetical protein n=1 Tax=Acidovorax sp. SUPP2825 TaxID=2920879 RepID=UPI0023DE5D3E|nr:hypothetical protein [Acidovorax sp. SUPP2825]GKS96982.1 hypothetical protein AVAK2825_20625 [Acidovorax sp. SUPP2825]